MGKLWVLCVAVLGGTLAACASQLGLGLGFSEWGVSGGELWAEFRPEQSLAWRLSLTYLAPVLPGEGPALAFQGGGRWAGGEALQAFVALAGGVVVEVKQVGGPAIGWVASGTAGLKWLLGNWGVFAGASAYLALRQTPMGSMFYPYFLYTVGVMWGT